MRRTFLTTGSPRQTPSSQDESKRWYVLQNWRQDVAVIIDEAAVQRERAFFSPYGRVFGMVAGDTGFDGDYGAGDSSAISGWSTAYRAYADVNLDGTIDTTDAGYTTNAQLGWDALSRDGSTIGYAGYVQDDFIPTINHVRHRALKTDLGRWVQRDPAGYVDGANLYEYVRSSPVGLRDPMGLAATLREILCCLQACGIGKCRSAKKWAETAKSITQQAYPRHTWHNGPGDAFRHCLWSCKMQCEWPASDCAEKIGNCHEDAGRRGGQPADEEAMDRHNNEVGRQIGSDCYWTVRDSPGAQLSSKTNCTGCCIHACQQAEKQGRLMTKPSSHPGQLVPYLEPTYQPEPYDPYYTTPGTGYDSSQSVEGQYVGCFK